MRVYKRFKHVSLSRLFSLNKILYKISKSRDLIGPADPVSNIHPIKYVKKANETPLEVRLRESREELQNWNQSFWAEHNKAFNEAKKKFENEALKRKKGEFQTITADEMSVFYKKFLDEKWQTHFLYLFNWYRKNITTTFLHFRVLAHNLFKVKS